MSSKYRICIILEVWGLGFFFCPPLEAWSKSLGMKSESLLNGGVWFFFLNRVVGLFMGRQIPTLKSEDYRGKKPLIITRRKD